MMTEKDIERLAAEAKQAGGSLTIVIAPLKFHERVLTEAEDAGYFEGPAGQLVCVPVLTAELVRIAAEHFCSIFVADENGSIADCLYNRQYRILPEETYQRHASAYFSQQNPRTLQQVVRDIDDWGDKY